MHEPASRRHSAMGSGGWTRKSRCVDFTSRLVANAVSKMGEMGDAALARVSARLGDYSDACA